jgi:hypothetical protein
MSQMSGLPILKTSDVRKKSPMMLVIPPSVRPTHIAQTREMESRTIDKVSIRRLENHELQTPNKRAVITNMRPPMRTIKSDRVRFGRCTARSGLTGMIANPIFIMALFQ